MAPRCAGKIGIPDSILTKEGPLEPGEAAIMREHVTRGAEIASKALARTRRTAAAKRTPSGVSRDQNPR